MSKLSSAEVLERLWLRFVRRYEDRYSVRLSMRGFSTEILNYKSEADQAGRPGQDAQALSRWINPGERENYRIPLARIAEVGQKLEALPDDIDDLMAARLRELWLANPAHETIVVGDWVADLCARSYRLTPDEQVLLKLYRDATRHLDNELFQSEESQGRLKSLLDTFLEPTWEQFWKDLADTRAEDAAQSADDIAAFTRARDTMFTHLARKRAEERAQDRAEQLRARQAMPAQRIAKQLLKNLRSHLAR